MVLVGRSLLVLILSLALRQAFSLQLVTSQDVTKIRRALKARIRKHVDGPSKDAAGAGTVLLNDETLGAMLNELQNVISTSANARRFDPAQVAGSWRVIHAPHLAFLSRLVGAQFDPIEYHLTTDSKMTSCVQYKLLGNRILGPTKEGWLCTSGYYYTYGTSNNEMVRIVWEKAWWNASPSVRPTMPEQGTAQAIIQSLGQVGFIEPLSFFPVKYVDSDLAIFQFFGFTITAMKQPRPPKPSILVNSPPTSVK